MKKKSVVLVGMLLTMLGSYFSVQAAEKDSSSVFSISPLHPDTNEPQSDYFNLLVIPKEEKTIQVRVYNGSNQDLKIQVAANDGTTNDNGITSYQGETERDSSLEVAFSDIATIKEPVVTVSKNGYLDVPVELTVPEKTFEGVILGGIRVTLAEEKDSEKPETAAVTNNIAYTVGVVLREKDELIAPKLILNDVKTEQRNYRNYISANLQNKAPRIIKALTATAEVTKKGDDRVIYMSSNQKMRMAPHSNFNYGISLEDQAFIAGDYLLKISGTADEVPYQFEKEFTIDEKAVKEMNQNAVFVEKEENATLLVVISGAVLLIVIGLFVYFGVWKKRKGYKKK